MIERILPKVETAYSMPTEVVYGRGALERIGDEKLITGARKIILVAGGHFKKAPEFTSLKKTLLNHGRNLILFDDKIATSGFATINGLINFMKENQPDVIVAVGGGTIIDTAKCAAILTWNPGGVEEYLINGKKIVEEGVSLAVIPTTAGTGSEVTPWAVVWDYKNREKYSLSSPLMFPSLAIVDPALTDEMPPKITAETGMDALTQAIEAFWSKFHNPVSDAYALQAIILIMDNLEKAVNVPNEEARDNMAKGSLFSGLAFSNTKTTICHSISYPMTLHWGITHGQAVSVTLPKMVDYSLPVLEKGRCHELLCAMSVKTIAEAARKIEKLMTSINLMTKLSMLGIKEKDLDIIVGEGYNPDRMGNAPRVPAPAELKGLLKSIL